MKKTQSVIIIGASEHAKVIVDIFEKEGHTNIVGFVDSNKQIGSEHAGYPILGNEEIISELLNKYPGCKLFIAIGDNWTRKQVKDKIDTLVPKTEYISAIHPSAIIGKNVVIGNGVAIMAGAIINPYSQIDSFSIINTRSSVDHDCIIGKFSNLAPGVTLGGNVKIGEYTAISIGAIITHGTNIGDQVIIGAGALLLNDCEDNAVMYGTPAKKIKMREAGEKYL